jgi:peptidoglycan/LPS O-acetylase OafA/YrhL
VADAKLDKVDRANNLDAIRLVLALLVIFSHSYPLLLGRGHPDPLRTVVKYEGLAGTAVGLFFAISGMLIVRSWEHTGNVVRYVWKRMLRIYPALIAASLFSVFVVGIPAIINGWYPPPARVLLRAVKLMEPVAPPIFSANPFPNSVNGSLWTIRYEVLCDAFVALGLFKYRWTALGAFLVSYLIYLPISLGVPVPHYTIPHVGDIQRAAVLASLATFFCAGAVLYRYRQVVRYTNRGIAISLWVLLLSIPLHLYAAVLPIAATYLMFAVAFHPRVPFPRYGRYGWGDLSYGTYVYAFPIQQLLVWRFGSVLNPWTLFVLSVLLVLPVAFASWHWLEGPALRLRNVRRRTAASTSGG